jgi:hypothetical protein
MFLKMSLDWLVGELVYATLIFALLDEINSFFWIGRMLR